MGTMTTATMTASTGCNTTDAQLQVTVTADGETGMLAIRLDGQELALTRIVGPPLVYRTVRPADGWQHTVELVDVSSGATTSSVVAFPANCQVGVISPLTAAPVSLTVAKTAQVGGQTELAFTGSHAGPLAAVGVALALAGVAMTRWARSLRTSPR